MDVFVRDTTPGILGAQQGGQPRGRGRMHVRYKVPELGRHGGLSVGASVIHASERPLSATTTGQFIPAYQSYSFNANYAAAKGGIMSFTKTLAAQYVQHNIRANAIGPGSIRTERAIKRYENKEWMQAEKPTGAVKERMIVQKLYPFSVGNPIDSAAIVVFLASDESRMLTGTTIAADGGRSSYLKIYAGED